MLDGFIWRGNFRRVDGVNYIRTKKVKGNRTMNRQNDIEPNAQAEAAASDAGTELRGFAIWDQVAETIKTRVSASDYERWLQDLRFVAEVEGKIVIATRERLDYDRIANSAHMALIRRVWREHDPKKRSVRLVCWRTADAELRAFVEDPWKADVPDAAQGAGGGSPPPPTDTDLESVSSPEMTFENLVVGKSNEIAVAFARKVAAGHKVGTALTLIYGSPGIGKTHILTALKQYGDARKTGRNIVYVTAEEFLAAYQEGVKARDTVGLKKRLQSADVLLVDDLHRISGKRGTENELFQNLREVTAKGGQVIIVSDMCAGNITGFSTAMRSELRGGTSIEVELPDADMRRTIVENLADHIVQKAPEFVLSAEMISRITSGIRGPGRELSGAVWSLFTAANFGKRAPTSEMLDRIIRQQEGEHRKPTIELVKRAAMKVFEISKSDIESKSKAQIVVYPRQVAMFLCREMTGKSYPQIARSFRKSDHTTVIYACRKIQKKAETSPELVQDIEAVRKMVLDLQIASKTTA